MYGALPMVSGSCKLVVVFVADMMEGKQPDLSDKLGRLKPLQTTAQSEKCKERKGS